MIGFIQCACVVAWTRTLVSLLRQIGVTEDEDEVVTLSTGFLAQRFEFVEMINGE